MAEGNEYLAQATQALYECNSDEIIRQQCRAREEYYRYQRTIDKALKDTTAERDRLATENKQLTSEVNQLATENNQLATENNQLATEKADALEKIQTQEYTIKEKDAEILRLKALLEKKDD